MTTLSIITTSYKKGFGRRYGSKFGSINLITNLTLFPRQRKNAYLPFEIREMSIELV
jgi:hypothetical protein